MRFIASDSTTIGEYLDGGSLIEAALDDIILYDVIDPNHDNTNDLDASVSLLLMPNPASDLVRIENMLEQTPIRIYNSNGSLVYEGTSDSNGILSLDVSSWAQGVYSVQARNSMARRNVLKLEVFK